MRILLSILLVHIFCKVSGQLHVSPGAQLHLSGNAQLTIRDMNFVNNGSFSAGNGTVHFTGATSTNIGGTQAIQFYTLQLSKDPNQSLLLQRSIGVAHQLQFSQGILDLNGNDIDLGGTGVLIGENETSHIVGAGGGEVLINAVLNAPVAVDAGNLGAVISSSKNLGSVLIKRGHQQFTLTNGNSILRSYTIAPANNSALDATLRFNYLDSELNGIEENKLAMWRSVDGVTWEYENFSGRDEAENYVDRTGIDAFSIWTLSTQSSSLPVVFSGFNLQCEGDRVRLTWKTAQEMNSSHFIVERNDGNGWVNIGRLPAAGQSDRELSYEFVDQNATGRSYYRIAQYDIDGAAKHTSIAVADCASAELLQVWPNPFPQSFTVIIRNSGSGMARLRVTDAKGVLIQNRQLNLMNGINQFDIDMRQVASGVYFVTVEWPANRQVKTMRLIKQ